MTFQKKALPLQRKRKVDQKMLPDGGSFFEKSNELQARSMVWSQNLTFRLIKRIFPLIA